LSRTRSLVIALRDVDDEKTKAYQYSIIIFTRGPERFYMRSSCDSSNPFKINVEELKAAAKKGYAAGELHGEELLIDPAQVFPECDPDYKRAELVPEVFCKNPCLLDYTDRDARTNIRNYLAAEARLYEKVLGPSPHKNIVTYHGCSVEDGRIAGICLDRLDEDLCSRRDNKNKPPLDVKRVVLDVGEALAHLHKLGYCHNDVNPQNIMVTRDDKAVLIDFDSCLLIGEPLTKGTMAGWGLGSTTSRVETDNYGLAQVEKYLLDPSMSVV